MLAEERAMEMMNVPRKDLPPLAREYASHLCGKFGGCMEVFITAYAHYAQCIERLECQDGLYRADSTAEAWFEGKAGLALAVLAYDKSIAGAAVRGDCELLQQGGGTTSSDELDRLYLDMLHKAKDIIGLPRGLNY